MYVILFDSFYLLLFRIETKEDLQTTLDKIADYGITQEKVGGGKISMNKYICWLFSENWSFGADGNTSDNYERPQVEEEAALWRGLVL